MTMRSSSGASGITILPCKTAALTAGAAVWTLSALAAMLLFCGSYDCFRNRHICGAGAVQFAAAAALSVFALIGAVSALRRRAPGKSKYIVQIVLCGLSTLASAFFAAVCICNQFVLP